MFSLTVQMTRNTSTTQYRECQSAALDAVKAEVEKADAEYEAADQQHDDVWSCDQADRALDRETDPYWASPEYGRVQQAATARRLARSRLHVERERAYCQTNNVLPVPPRGLCFDLPADPAGAADAHRKVADSMSDIGRQYGDVLLTFSVE
jgi:hypothetical protein